jgi:hypothetical protein
MSGPALYRLLTLHVKNLMSIYLSLGRLSKVSVQVRGFWIKHMMKFVRR